ncbi:conserved hypothetical protein [Coccidioides posadasii str. Silveira]|uniref:Uncharacterized protein n=1 Tax=Coccidioides posadasii (strain RMSCC 757 / Silveira) TaxID=443226 RepID=E9D1X9_COCPS|nr:conserved hypothetical protein [Coccidioides posadasii str. Silveira]
MSAFQSNLQIHRVRDGWSESRFCRAWLFQRKSYAVKLLQFIAEKSTICIPCLHGYSIKQDNPLGLPFMLLDYVEGRSLFTVEV